MRPDRPIDRYLRWRRPLEIGFWVAVILINAAANSTTVLVDMQRFDLDFADWEPMVWEWTSGLMLLALVPALVWFTRRFPLHWDSWRRQLPWYLLASMLFSLVHVLGMGGLRKLAYATLGSSYDFSAWPRQLIYEYLKDVRTFLLLVAMIELYRLVLRRWQGEARLFDRPDEGDPVDPVDCPERFLVRKLGREFLVAADDIEWIQAAGNYVNLHVRGRDYPLRSTIAGIEEKLAPGRFVRVHRSYIVNLKQIDSIEPMDAGDARLHMRDTAVVPCSRRYREQLRICIAGP